MIKKEVRIINDKEAILYFDTENESYLVASDLMEVFLRSMQKTLNDAWYEIFKDYISAYEGMQALEFLGVFDEEEKAVHEHNLLFHIIESMKAEIEKINGCSNMHENENDAR